MALTRYTVQQYSTFNALATYKDENGAVINLTGATVYFTVKQRSNSNELFSYEITNHIAPLLGQTNIPFEQNDLAVLGEYFGYTTVVIPNTDAPDGVADVIKYPVFDFIIAKHVDDGV